MKTLIYCLLFLIATNTSFAKDKPAKDKPFQDYFDVYSEISSACGNARDFDYAVSSGSDCELAIKIALFQKPGANLVRLAKQRMYHPISFWVEERTESGYEKWRKISVTKQYRFNATWQAISFKVYHSAVYRIAIDFKGQIAFADQYSNHYKVSAK